MQATEPIFKVGDRVLVQSGTEGIPARIVSLRGPLGRVPKQYYGITVRGSFKRHYVEVGEDQLEPAATAKS